MGVHGGSQEGEEFGRRSPRGAGDGEQEVERSAEKRLKTQAGLNFRPWVGGDAQSQVRDVVGLVLWDGQVGSWGPFIPGLGESAGG